MGKKKSFSPTGMSARQEETETKVIESIYDDLKKAMKSPDVSGNKTFICKQDARLTWSTKRLEALFPRHIAGLERLQKNAVIILSVIVWIHAETHLAEFVDDFFNRLDSPTDIDLPFRRRQLQFLAAPAHKDHFLETQYRFLPVIIDVSVEQRTQIIPPLYRLPFESVERDVFMGGYGTVDKVTISECYLRLKHEGNILVPNVRRHSSYITLDANNR